MTLEMTPAAALLTDVYQLAMMQTYRDHGMDETAVFEMFVRRLPASRGFLVAAGLEQALAFLEGLRFGADELRWLRQTGRFRSDFVDSLASFHFTGDVDAMPEGTVFFAHEPILRVVAPLPQAQLVETRLLNLVHLQTVIASKAARCVLAAPGKLLVDFGFRRAYGAEAGVLAARAAHLVGFAGTSAVLAGALHDIPLYGTMAHSFVQAHDDEAAAFERFARSHPTNATILIDTYDVEAAAVEVASLHRRLASEGNPIRAVRIDSGDLAAHASRVRRILDREGAPDVRIFASGDLDEKRVAQLLTRGAPIDGFGIGTRLATSADAPSLDIVYKLQEYAGQARRKRSEGKATWPGRKQVRRRFTEAGLLSEDWLTLMEEEVAGEPLLRPFMRNGRRVAAAVPLAEIRSRARAELGRLPATLRALRPVEGYSVAISSGIRELAERLDRGVTRPRRTEARPSRRSPPSSR